MVKFSHIRCPALGPELIPVYRQSARRWREVNPAIDPAVGCHYLPLGPQLPSRPVGRYQFRGLVNSDTMGLNSLPKTVTRQRRGCDLNSGLTAPESSTLTTRLPSRPTTSGGKLLIRTLTSLLYNTRCYFNVRSKANMSQLNLPHGTDN